MSSVREAVETRGFGVPTRPSAISICLKKRPLLNRGKRRSLRWSTLSFDEAKPGKSFARRGNSYKVACLPAPSAGTRSKDRAPPGDSRSGYLRTDESRSASDLSPFRFSRRVRRLFSRIRVLFRPKRSAFARYCSDVAIDSGINDLNASPASLAISNLGESCCLVPSQAACVRVHAGAADRPGVELDCR
jgi:hypothetical protein